MSFEAMLASMYIGNIEQKKHLEQLLAELTYAVIELREKVKKLEDRGDN